MPVWVSRDNVYIELCDRGSREYRADDYSLTQSCLANILKSFPPITVDAMASATNAITQKFYLKFPSFNNSGVDFFAQRLDYTEFYFVFAPVSLSINVTRFLASQEVRGILIIPL